MKRKAFRGVLIIAMIVAIMASMMVPVFAKYVEYTSCIDLEPGVVVSGKNPTEWYSSSSGNYYTCLKGYKIIVPSSGYLTFNNYRYKSSVASFTLFKYQNSVLKHYTPYRECMMNTGTWSSSIPVAKGTYYIYPGLYDSTMNYKFKYTFTKQVSDTKNYCKAHATPLAAGTKKVINVLENYSYPRWYKINVSYKHALTITLEDMDKWVEMDPTITLQSASGKQISLDYISGNNYSSTIVSPGTYYICINTYFDYVCLYRLSWK